MKLQSLLRKNFSYTTDLIFLLIAFFPRVSLSVFSKNKRRNGGANRYLAKKISRKHKAALPCHFSQAPPGQEPRSKKEVFQPHLPVRLPCYDLAPVTRFALGRSLRSRTSGAPDFHGLTGGVYKARERIHRAMADARLLANPASRSRVADSDPN